MNVNRSPVDFQDSRLQRSVFLKRSNVGLPCDEPFEHTVSHGPRDLIFCISIHVPLLVSKDLVS
jgi:hypothetical protein